MDDELLQQAQDEVARIKQFVADGRCTASAAQIQYLCNLGCALDKLEGIDKATASALISKLVDQRYDEEYPDIFDTIDVSYEAVDRLPKVPLPALMNANPRAGNFNLPPPEIPYIPNMEPSPSQPQLPPSLPVQHTSFNPTNNVVILAVLIIGAFAAAVMFKYAAPAFKTDPQVSNAFDYGGLDPYIWRLRMNDAKSRGKEPYWPTERERQSNIVLPNLVRGGVYSIVGTLNVRSQMSTDPESDGKSWSSTPNAAFQCISMEEFNGLIFYGVRAFRWDGAADGFIEASQLAYVTVKYQSTEKIR